MSDDKNQAEEVQTKAICFWKRKDVGPDLVLCIKCWLELADDCKRGVDVKTGIYDNFNKNNKVQKFKKETGIKTFS